MLYNDDVIIGFLSWFDIFENKPQSLKSNMTTYKLIYFDLKGRAEVCRMLFALANQSFDDVRVPFLDWPEIKLKLPFGQAPVLEVTESSSSRTYQIAQSHAIERYLARKFDLAGKSELERAQCDMLVEQMVDIINMLILIYSGVKWRAWRERTSWTRQCEKKCRRV